MHPHHLCNHFNRTFITEAFTRANIHLIRNGVQRLLAMYRQVRALGQILANQTVNVFIATALPRAMRVAKINRHPCALRDFSMLGHLASLVIRHAFTHRQGHAVQCCTETLNGRSSRGIIHFHQNQITVLALAWQSALKRLKTLQIGVGFTCGGCFDRASQGHGSIGQILSKKKAPIRRSGLFYFGTKRWYKTLFLSPRKCLIYKGFRRMAER